MKKLFSMVAAALLALFGLSAQAQELTVRFFDMGKADAMLITAPSGEQILIDAGTNKGGKKLAERFAKDGVNAIDLMIITHFDKDHVGGADKVLESVPVARVVMPEYAKESKRNLWMRFPKARKRRSMSSARRAKRHLNSAISLCASLPRRKRTTA